MSIICPTITAYTLHDYHEQIGRIESFARRLHIDVSDDQFAHPRTVGLHELHWPEGLDADIHVMYQHPARYLSYICELKPQLVIVHAEADGDFMAMADKLHGCGIKIGIALLPLTLVAAIIPALPSADHVLIFSGNLGHQGGSTADFNLLSRVDELRRHKQDLEIGWDGGVNPDNAARLSHAGIDVLNVGGFIQHSQNPAEAYATLEALA